MMKKLGLLAIGLCLIAGLNAQEMKTIKLKAPDKQRGVSVMEALAKRQSIREFANKPLSSQDLSDLLWAANGINRPEIGYRTAPSALNSQEIDLYVCMEEGAYLYNAKEHELRPVTNEDLRSVAAAGQDWVTDAPVVLVLVADMARFKSGDNAGARMTAACDAGIVSQNIALFCSGCGLATVPRGTMDKARLTEKLKLTSSQLPILNNPVGYAK